MPPMVEPVDTLWDGPTVERYTAKKMNEWASTAWVDVANTELSERSQNKRRHTA